LEGVVAAEELDLLPRFRANDATREKT